MVAENIHKIHHYVDKPNADIRVDFDQTKFNTGEIKSISNIEHEEKVNEEKRQIKVLNQNLLRKYRQFRKLIREN